MHYKLLLFAHIFTILPCIPLGFYLLISTKRNKWHRSLGKIYMVLMFFTAGITLFMPAYIGPKLFNHFGYIHCFSLLTLYSIPTALMAIKNGKIRVHRMKMINLYVGAILIAGALTLLPGRYLHNLLFQ